jgi:Ca2+-binding EF-hand superfamily protein
MSSSQILHDQAATNYKEAFSLFDQRGNGQVALESLGDLLRACGQNPTLAEIRELETTVGGDCERPIPCAVMRWKCQPALSREDGDPVLTEWS